MLLNELDAERATHDATLAKLAQAETRATSLANKHPRVEVMPPTPNPHEATHDPVRRDAWDEGYAAALAQMPYDQQAADTIKRLMAERDGLIIERDTDLRERVRREAMAETRALMMRVAGFVWALAAPSREMDAAMLIDAVERILGAAAPERGEGST
jgi:hypothetical protein